MSEPQVRIDGAVAVVTGARQGMGAVFAQELARAGARVACVDLLDDDELRSVAADIGGVAFAADCSDPNQIRDLARRVQNELGDARIVVANHAYMTMEPLQEHDAHDWWKVIDTNLGGTFFLIQAFLPQLRATTGPESTSKVVVITSEWGIIGWPDATAYSASKAGLVSMVKTLARELSPLGISVNGIAPGVTDTQQLQVDATSAGVELGVIQAQYAADIPLGRIATPKDIADTVMYLVNPRVRSLTGQILQTNGGSTRTRA